MKFRRRVPAFELLGLHLPSRFRLSHSMRALLASSAATLPSLALTLAAALCVAVRCFDGLSSGLVWSLRASHDVLWSPDLVPAPRRGLERVSDAAAGVRTSR